MEKYIKVYIKSEADLPKVTGQYMVYVSDDDQIQQWYFNLDPQYSNNFEEDWLENVNWYLLPVPPSAILTDEEINNEALQRFTSNTGWIDHEKIEGFKRGVKWLQSIHPQSSEVTDVKKVLVEMEMCECGHEVPIDFAQYDGDCSTCLNCVLEEAVYRLEREKKLTKKLRLQLKEYKRLDKSEL